MTTIFTRNSTTLLTSLRAMMFPVLVLTLLFSTQVKAQLVYNESFDTPTNSLSLPLGWTQGKYGGGTDPDNYWDRVTAGTLPPCTPHTGTGMARYLSWYITAGEKAFLASKMLDMRSIPGAGAPVSFWMYREEWGTFGGSAYMDSITVYVNTTPDLAGSPMRLTSVAPGPAGALNLPRPCSQTPAVAGCPTPQWVQYNYTIPASFNGSSVYVIILGCSRFGNDMYIDDFSVTSYPQGQVYTNNSATVFQQNTATTARGATNQQIIGCKLNVVGAGISATMPALTQMQFNTNGSTNPATDITNAKLWFSGGTPTFDPTMDILLGTWTPNLPFYPWATNFTFLDTLSNNGVGRGFFRGLEDGDNYFWITYDIKASATQGDYVDAEWIGMNMAVVKDGVTGAAAATTITVPDNVGLVLGMTAVGPGISLTPARTITNIAGTTITLSGANTGAVSGTVYFTNGAAPIVPVTQTLAGRRKIDQIYCSASYSVGTSWAGYVTNDYINGVRLTGDNIPSPGIANYNGTPTGPFASSYYTGSNTITTPAGSRCPSPGPCPHQSHPPDYELFGAVPNKSTSITQNKVYPITVQTGDYNSGNAVAAWIDYNGDGTFNNFFDTVVKPAWTTPAGVTYVLHNNQYINNGASGNNDIGLRVGMQVSGAGIAPGSTITSITANGTNNQINLSAATTAAIPTNTVITYVNVYNPADPLTLPEKILQSGSESAYGTEADVFTVPSVAVPGKTRMRVREVWINYNISPCASATYGEVEDYEVTIVPDCPGATGWTTWLGFTDDWTDPSNWCPAKAPISINIPAVNVRLPGGPSGVYDYVKPVIRSTTLATAVKLRVEPNDSLFIDAPTPGSLTVTDSVFIQGANSRIIVNSLKLDSAQVDNGLLSTPTVPTNNSPLRNATYCRSFMVFTQAELLAKGMIANDLVTQMRMHIKRQSNNGAVYNNFTLKYYYTTPGWVAASAIAGGTIPPVVTAGGQIYFNAALSVSSIPMNAYGSIIFPLSPGFNWNGSANQLVIEMCYDVSSSTGLADQPSNTQTTGFQRYLTLNSTAQLASPPTPACSMEEGITATAASNRKTTTGVAGSTTITIVGPNMNNLVAGQLVTFGANIPANTYIVSVGAGFVTISNPITTGWTNITGVAFGANVQATASLYRPNLTFEFDRPYGIYPVNVGGHWGNNGNFTAGKSIVTFNGTINQDVAGTTPTTFYKMAVNNPTSVTRLTDITITDSLVLTNGRLKLNNGLVSLLNTDLTALSFTSGRIQGETDVIANNVAPYGRFRWTIGNVPGLRTIPFATAVNYYIPFKYEVVNGSHDVIFSTYKTNQNNTNIPAPEVTNIFGPNNAAGGGAWGTDGYTMVDRYYQINNTTPAGATANLTFAYQPGAGPAGEEAQAGNTNMLAQRWNSTQDRWVPLFLGQTFTPSPLPLSVPHTIYYPNFAMFDSTSWWTIVGQANPLPISLLEFKAEKQKDRVKLKWTTASEINNSHFVINRSLDNASFDYIGRVESRGPSSNIQEYYLYDNDPVMGTQYYYLDQYDYDGKSERFGPVSATFSKDVFDIVTTTVSSTDKGLTVVFNYNSEEPYSYRIMDMTGRVIVAKDRNPAVNGLNVIDIDASLAKGAYHIVLQNSSKVVSRKFFY